MSGNPAIPSSELMRAEKRAAAGSSVLAALVITGLKVVVGFSTGSLGILSEAAHSALDLIASLLTFFSVGVSDKPADAEHQYGHGKIENFSAFVETGLLLLTCAWIIYEAVQRLFFRHIEIEPSIAAFAVMLFSMGLDWWRSRVLGRIANKYDSQALEADALHFSTDIWSAGVVVLGLALVLLGRTYRVDWLRDSDPVAALFVAGVVVSVSWRMARRTIDALLDAAPPGRRYAPRNLRRGLARGRRSGSRSHPHSQSRKPLFRRSRRGAGAHRNLPALRPVGRPAVSEELSTASCPTPT